MKLSKSISNLNKRIETQMVNLEMTGKFGKLNKRKINLNEICVVDFLKKLEEFSFRSFGFIIKAIMMNIKQGYLDIYKDLALFLEVHMVKKKNKKNFLGNTNNEIAKDNKNKTLNEKTFNDEETNYRSYNEITKFDNNRNQSKNSLINFSHSNIYNVIKESESILNEMKPVILNKSKKKIQQKENDLSLNPYGLLRLSHKKDKSNSQSNIQILVNANISYNQESTFNFNQKNEFSTNNFSNSYNQPANLHHNNNSNYSANINSDNKFKRNSCIETLIEDSKEYEDDEESQHKQKVDRTIEIDDNLAENLFSSAINFGVFKEFPVINYNKIIYNNNKNNKNDLIAIEENDFEENFNLNENNEYTQNKNVSTTPIKTDEKEKLSEKASNNNRNSFSNDQIHFTQTQNPRNSISKFGFNDNSKNNFLFALNSLEKKLSKDDFIQQELDALNGKYLNADKKKKIKGLKFDREIHIDFYERMKIFLSKDLKNDIQMENFSYHELMRRKVLHENRKLLKRCHEVILLESQLKNIKEIINKEKDPCKKESFQFDKTFNLFDNVKNLSKRGKPSRSTTKSKRILLGHDGLENNEKNKEQSIENTFCNEEKVCEIKNKSIPLIDKSEKLFILNDFSRIKENEQQINISLLNKTKPIKSDLNHSENSERINNKNASINNSNNNSKTSTITDLKNLSSKYDKLRRNSVTRNRNSILNTNGEYPSKNDDFGTPDEIFENKDLSQKNLNNLKNFNINKYLNTLNDVITEEDSNFNNNFFTNLETTNLNENKDYKNNLNFEDLPEENENLIEEDEEIEHANDSYDEEHAEIINNLKYDFIKNAIFQYLKMTKDRNLYYNNCASIDNFQGGSLNINIKKINKIFYENTENSNLGYKQKEDILKNEEENFGSIFYALLLESQKGNLNIYQNELFGEIIFDV